MIFAAKFYGFTLVRSDKLAKWGIFDHRTAELRGWLTDSEIIRQTDNAALIEYVERRFVELAGDMGALYAIRDEARRG